MSGSIFYFRSHWFCAVLCFPYLNVDHEVVDGHFPTKRRKLESGDVIKVNDIEIQLPKKPCILIFDSMNKYIRDNGMVYRTLWKFLTAEIAVCPSENYFTKTSKIQMLYCIVIY